MKLVKANFRKKLQFKGKNLAFDSHLPEGFTSRGQHARRSVMLAIIAGIYCRRSLLAIKAGEF